LPSGWISMEMPGITGNLLGDMSSATAVLVRTPREMIYGVAVFRSGDRPVPSRIVTTFTFRILLPIPRSFAYCPQAPSNLCVMAQESANQSLIKQMPSAYVLAKRAVRSFIWTANRFARFL
jgi:hypothetical protein